LRNFSAVGATGMISRISNLVVAQTRTVNHAWRPVACMWIAGHFRIIDCRLTLVGEALAPHEVGRAMQSRLVPFSGIAQMKIFNGPFVTPLRLVAQLGVVVPVPIAIGVLPSLFASANHCGGRSV
jgi:hypothetical protein